MERSEFLAFRAAILPTLESLGIAPSGIILVGGAGLAAYGIDTFWGVRTSEWREHERAYAPPDLDGFLEQEAFDDIQERADTFANAEKISEVKIHIPPQRRGLLPFDGVLLRERARLAMEQEGAVSIEVDGLRTLPAHTLARLKNARDSWRDTVGIVLGHHEAYRQGLTVVNTPLWREELDFALDGARNLHFTSADERNSIASEYALPQSFLDLVDNDFDDPAFR